MGTESFAPKFAITVPALYRSRKILGWSRLLAGFASVQVVIQVVGFLCGILVVRSLSKPDYAWFTIANTLAATMLMLADVGVSGALSAVGGRVWQDNVRFGSLVRTALAMRHKLAVASILVVTPVFVWLLVKNEAPWATIAFVVIVSIIGFSLQLTSSVLGAVISLRQEIARIQVLGLSAAFLRLVLLGSACLVFIDARVAILIGTIAVALQVWLLRRWVGTSIDLHAPLSPDYRREILAVVRKQAPLTIFFCFQSQVSVWLLSVFGSAQSVADFGALGRFAMIFMLLTSVANGLVVPRFARCQDSLVLRRRYWQIAVGFASLAAVLVMLSAAYPGHLLALLGPRYALLEKEVWLMMLGSALSGMFITLHALTFSKAWIAPAGISIPMELAMQIMLFCIFDISTLRGVLLVGCLSPIAPIILNVIVAHLNLRSGRNVAI